MLKRNKSAKYLLVMLNIRARP